MNPLQPKKSIGQSILRLLGAILIGIAVGLAALPLRQLMTPALRFSELSYERPDIAAAEEHFAELSELACSGEYRELRESINLCWDDFMTFNEMYEIAQMRFYHDMTDEFYGEEFRFLSENEARMYQLLDGFYYDCAASPYGERLERDEFWDGFCEEYSDRSESVYTENYVALSAREKSLLNDYHDLLAAPMIEWNGEERDFNALSEEMNGEEYSEALSLYYERYVPLLGELYLELISVREELAAERGFESYEQLQYEDFYHRSFTPAEVETLCAAASELMAPVYFYSGVAPAEDFSALSTQELRETVGRAVEALGAPMTRAYSHMLETETCDLEMTAGKFPNSFEVYLTSLGTPYLFLYPSGTEEDILSLAHEFGHYTDDYANSGSASDIDLAEFFSQAMEYLVLNELEGETAERLEQYKLAEMMAGYLQQLSFIEFEHEVYALPESERTVEKICEISLQTARDFGYFEAGGEDYYAASWIDIPHFFEYPFYVVSYALSADVAFQVYEAELNAPGEGLKLYRSILVHDCSDLLEAVEAGGFADPFDRAHIEDMTAVLMRRLAR